MSTVNKVILIARLGRDPEVRYTPSGSAVTNVSAATSRRWKNKETGDPQEETEWHRLVAYDRLAEMIGEYLKKGSLAYFEGRLKTRKWTDKDGADRYTTEIVVDQMTMLGSRQDAQGDASAAAAPAARRPATHSEMRQQRMAEYGATQASTSSAPPAAAARPPSSTAAPATGFDDMDNDIPF